jgi:hypothetical protein
MTVDEDEILSPVVRDGDFSDGIEDEFKEA